MLNTMSRARVRPFGRVKASGFAIGALILGTMSTPIMAQQLMSAQSVEQLTEVAADRLCTAGFNTDYGWFDVTAINRFGVLEFPGQLTSGACTNSTAAGLAVDLGTLPLTLAGPAIYHIGTPSTVRVNVLEPALCEDYYAGAVGTPNWQLDIIDANGDAMQFGTGPGVLSMPGVTAVDYAAANGAIRPVRADTDAQWLRCHSGLAANAGPPAANPVDPDHVFSDGFEQPLADLRVDFLDAQGGAALPGDVIDQGVAATVSYRVRVSNIGSWAASQVRIREFVPTNAPNLGPTVTRTACIDHGVSGNDNTPCTNGIGADKFAVDLATLAAGAHRDFTFTRASSGTVFGAGQSQALIQVAAFSDPAGGVDANYADNSRSLRIKVVDQVTITRAVWTNGSAGGAGGTIARTSAPVGCAAEVGVASTCPPGTTGLVYTASASTGFTFTGFTGCAGTTSGMSEIGGSLTTTAPSSCTVTANFRSKPVVTTSVSGTNGAITPPSQDIHYNTQAFFTVNPSTGYEVDTITGCGGVVHHMGNTWKTTAPVTANCAVLVSFKPITSTVTANAGLHGTVTSQNPVQITYPTDQAFFVVEADANYVAEAANSSSCTNVTGPVPNPFGAGVMFSANSVMGDCEIDLIFNLVTYPVTTDPAIVNGKIWFLDAGGAQVSSTSIDVPHGQSATFNLIPDSGYKFNLPGDVSAAGCSLASVNYNPSTQIWSATTSAITGTGCQVSAVFTPL
ncbi:MAG TPA: hypothetical protein VFN29_12780 [Chiayiivirga sp.]|nr:hypothetical protein [Chiayiivirga sp.]